MSGRRAAKVDANHACPVCFQETSDFDSKGRGKVYCSRRCGGRVVGSNGAARVRGALNRYTCANCSVEFLSYYKARLFCSRKCTGEYRTKHWIAPYRGRNLTDERKRRLSLATKDYMSRYGTRRDKNHHAIVVAFRKLGCDVIDMAELGNGCPDIAVFCRGAWHVIEIKNPETHYGKRGLSKRQKKWAALANAPVYLLRGLDDVARFANGDTEGMKAA